MKLSSPSDHPKNDSYQPLRNDQKGHLSGSIKTYLITALSIGGAIAIRDALGFQNTAIAIASIGTVFGFASAGSISLFTVLHLNGRNNPQNAENKDKQNPLETSQKMQSRIQQNAYLGGAVGLIASLGILTIFESSFQIFQVLRDYID